MALTPGAPGAYGTWWVVEYLTTGTLSRLAPQPEGTQFRVVQAPTQAAAISKVGGGITATGPFPTQAAAQASGNATKTAVDQATQAGHIPNPLSGLAAIGDFFSRLTRAATWMRIAEVALGLVLIAVGIARATGTQNQLSQLVRARLP